MAGPNLADLVWDSEAPKSAAPNAEDIAWHHPPTMVDDLKRSGGLVGRAAIEGVMSVPNIIGDAAAYGYNDLTGASNHLFGTHIAPIATQSQGLSYWLDRLGFPRPETPSERIGSAALSGVTSLATPFGVGKSIAGSDNAVTQKVGEALTRDLGTQATAAAGAGAGSATAQELGMGPLAQMGFGLAGGLGAAGAGAGLTKGVPALRDVISAWLTGGKEAPAATPAIEPEVIPAATAQPDQNLNITAQLLRGESPGQTITIAPAVQLEPGRPLDATGDFRGAAAQRAQDFRGLGIQPTLGQVTRDPDQFRWEIETAKGSTPAARDIRARLGDQNAQLLEVAQKLQGNLGGAPENAQQVGKSVVGALEAKQAASRRAVNAAYTAARNDPQAANGISLDPVSKLLAENESLEATVPELASARRELARQTAIANKGRAPTAPDVMSGLGNTPTHEEPPRFTVQQAEDFRQFLNTLGNPKDPRSMRFVGLLKDAVDEAVLNSADSDVFREARFQHALGRSEFADQGAVSDLLAKASRTDRQVPYEEVWDAAVRKGDLDGLKQIKNTLMTGAPGGEQAFNDLRARTWQYIVNAATEKGATNEAGAQMWSQTGYERGLKAIGRDKLSVLFSPEELATIDQIGRVGDYRLPPPVSTAGTNINYSNTASRVIDAVERIAGSPLVAKIPGGNFIKGMAIKGRMAADTALEAERARGALTPEVGLNQRQQAIARALQGQRAPGSPIVQGLFVGGQSARR